MRLQIRKYFLKDWKKGIVKFVIFMSLVIFVVQSVSAGAIIGYSWNGTHLIVNVTSPQGVGSAQIKLNISSDLTVGSAALTGFMTDAMHMQSGEEHRWFQMSANGNSSGVFTVPITCSFASGSYEVKLIDVNIKDNNQNSIALDTTMPMYRTINCGGCDLNHDRIITNDYNDLMTAYKCFLGIEKNCNNHYQDWKLIKQEYQCFTKNI